MDPRTVDDATTYKPLEEEDTLESLRERIAILQRREAEHSQAQYAQLMKRKEKELSALDHIGTGDAVDGDAV